MQNTFEIEVNTQKVYLSSFSQVHKTEQFISKTRNLLQIDNMLLLLSQNIMKNLEQLKNKFNISKNNFIVQTKDKTFSFYFTFPKNFSGKYKFLEYDFIYYNFTQNLINDNSDFAISSYLSNYKTFKILITTSNLSNEENFEKLYNLSQNNQINLPFLNIEQKHIVSIQDKNVLVQGVAGSGKTNICIDKILFTATKNYFGKVFYTTFSNSLLNDTLLRLQQVKLNITNFLENLKKNKIVFLDNNKKLAIENEIGLTLDDNFNTQNVSSHLNQILDFLDNKLELASIEDLYKRFISSPKKIADFIIFKEEYLPSIKNHQLKVKLEKINSLTFEILYKEIYGMLFGYSKSSNELLAFDDYVLSRKNSFTLNQCESIYALAQDYKEFLNKNNYTNLVFMSQELYSKWNTSNNYSLVIVDEVQDFTQWTLKLLRRISRKMFCVGDAMQMINPSYFSFSFLKDLMYEKDILDVVTLKSNYRNSPKINSIVQNLNKINAQKFGTHNFLISGESIPSINQTFTAVVKEKNFLENFTKKNIDNFTVVCSSHQEKSYLKSKYKELEILTVSEIKGLEREGIILYNILSSNLDKWQTLMQSIVNRKQADENSVYRYYFNLFYVGLTRAKEYLYVIEDKKVSLFEDFFKTNFDNLSLDEAITKIKLQASSMEIGDEKVINQINQLLQLEQFENAKFLCQKIKDSSLSTFQLKRIDIYANNYTNKNYKNAGIEFWKIGALSDAKKSFLLSNDLALVKLLDASIENNARKLNYDIINLLPEVINQQEAVNLIFQSLKLDIADLNNSLKETSKNLNKLNISINNN